MGRFVWVVLLIVFMGLYLSNEVECENAAEIAERSCPYNCFDQGNCHSGTCSCTHSAVGIYCAYRNISASEFSVGRQGLTVHAFAHESKNYAYASWVTPPYQDCNGMQFDFHVYEDEPTIIPDRGDTDPDVEYIFTRSFVVDLKSIQYDQVDPYCFPWIDHLYTESTACISIQNGRLTQPTAGDDDPHYLGDAYISFSSIPNQLFTLGSFSYAPPDRCSTTDCIVEYDNDLSSAQWNFIDIKSSSKNYIAVHTVEADAGRYVLTFKDFPPSSLTVSFALECQPSISHDFEVEEDYNSKQWIIFDNCGLVHDNIPIYFSFHCNTPCSFQVAPSVSYVTPLLPGNIVAPGHESVSFVDLYFSEAIINPRSVDQVAYDVIIQTFYTVTTSTFVEPKPYLVVRADSWSCPSAHSSPKASQPTSFVTPSETTTLIPFSAFPPDASIYLRVEIAAGACSEVDNAFACNGLTYNILLQEVDRDTGDHGNTKHHSGAVFWFFLLGFFLLLGVAAIGVVVYRWYKTGNLRMTTEGFSAIPMNTDFLEDESEVDEVVVAEENNDSSFRIPNNSFSL